MPALSVQYRKAKYQKLTTRDIAGVSTTEKQQEKPETRVGMLFSKEIGFNFFLNEETEVAERRSSGKSFQIYNHHMQS